MNLPALFSSSSRLSALATALAVALSLWGLERVNTFQVIDGLAYDNYLRLRTRLDHPPASVLLIEVMDRTAVHDAERLEGLVDELQRHGVAQVIFAIDPSQLSPDFLSAVEDTPNIVFARTLTQSPLDPDELRIAAAPSESEQAWSSSGIMHSPPSSAGVCRRQFGRFLIDGDAYPTLEVQAALLRGAVVPERFNDDQYLVDFRLGLSSLPRFSLERVFHDGLIPELVEGRSAIVGFGHTLGEPGLFTPVTSGVQTMSLLEYRGHSLNTLLSGRITQELPDRYKLVLLLGVALLALMAHQSFSVQAGSWLTAAGLCLYGGAVFALFVYARIWLPLTSVILCQVLLHMITVRGRALELTGAMRRLISDSSSQLRDKYWPSHFYTTKPSWALVANMINQTLDLNKLIFLEAQPGTSKLKEILALHCSLDDIVERRRDYMRSPYVDALKAKAPVKVTDYLQTTGEDEVQFVAPLLFCGRLLGFWAIGIERQKMAEVPQFDQLLIDYTERVSELLYHVRQSKEGESLVDSVKNRLAEERTEATYQALRSTLGLLDQRLITLERLIHRVNSGIIVYDIFGRILQINDVMLSLLKKEDLAPFEMTALDLILALSDYDVSRSRKILRRVVVENKAVSFPVSFRSKANHRFLIYFKPLLDDHGDEQSHEAGVRNVLCELVDTTATAFLAEMKSHLTGRLGLHLRSNLAAIEMSSSLLEKEEVRGVQREAIAGIVRSKVHNTVRALSECQQYLALEDDVEEIERFPVDPNDALEIAVEDVRVAAAERSVDVRVKKPNFISYVFASTRKLQELFKALSALLLHDAGDDSTILVRVSERQDMVVFDFSDTGFGIPNELLQEYVFGDHPLASEEFQKVQQAAKWVESWGGVLEATSGVGVGMRFTVQLVKFI